MMHSIDRTTKPQDLRPDVIIHSLVVGVGWPFMMTSTTAFHPELALAVEDSMCQYIGDSGLP
jgi:hypothetical protein